MKLHVLPGDAYVEAFRETGLEGEVAVFRECFIEGDLGGGDLAELWRVRAAYLSAAYPEQNDRSYPSYVVAEIDKIIQAAQQAGEIYLWFEYELFCSVNYWFCLELLRESSAELYRVSPTVRNETTRWRGFGRLASEEMLECWNDRVRLSAGDIARGGELWRAFRAGDRARVRELGAYESPAFRYLPEVAAAASDLELRPKQIIDEIAAAGTRDFEELFAEFARRAGVYGLGDVQVRRLMESAE
ncbi:MAG: DUF1835 domain-containing protein [Pyrinomonadaceae bacterium]